MAQRETLPIDHSTGSHVMHVGGGAVGGAVKGGLIGVGVWAATLSVVGALGSMALFGVGSAIHMVTGFTLGGSLLGAAAFGAIVPAVVVLGGAALIGVLGAPLVGAGIGAARGSERGHQQVQRDRAAAHMVDAEVGAMQAQAAAMQAQAQMVSAGGRPGDRYAGASTMNLASPQLDAATAARAGLVGTPQLEAARG